MGDEFSAIKGADPSGQREMLERGSRLRSDLLDVFARLEEVICERIPQEPKAVALTQKLNLLEKVAFRYPVKAKQRIDEIRRLIECRNDIVHSILTVAELSGGETGTYFIFRNVGAVPDCTGRQLRALNADELKALVSRVKTATKQLTDQPMKATTPTAPAASSA